MQFEISDRVATITFRSTDGNNYLDYMLLEQFRGYVETAEQDPSVKVILLQAEGGNFCAGADPGYLMKLQQLSLDENTAESAYLGHVFLLLLRSKKAVVAAAKGDSFSEGCTLLCCADYVLSTPDARFGWPDAHFGSIPAVSMLFGMRRIGLAHLRRLMLLAEPVSAAEAERIGLVDQIVSDTEDLNIQAQAFALRMAAKNAYGSTEFIKKMMADLPVMPLNEGLAFAAKINAHGRFTPEYLLGLQARAHGKEVEW